MLFANVVRKVFSIPVTGDSCCVGFGIFWAFGLRLGALCIWGLLDVLASLLCTKLAFFWCASNRARPLGVVGGRLEHYLSAPLGECFAAHKNCSSTFFQIFGRIFHRKSCMPALVSRPSSPWL